MNNNKDLDVDAKKDEPSFFGSFFAPKGGAAKKKGVAAMDAPPTNIRPQNALNERETMETEVISAYFFPSSRTFLISIVLFYLFYQNCLSTLTSTL